MWGSIVNGIAIILGALLGMAVGSSLQERFKNILMQAIPLGVIVIGVQPAIQTTNPLLLTASLVIGGLIGEGINIEAMLEKLGQWLQSKFKNQGNLAKGFVEASLIFCIGSMAIMGAIDSGLRGDNSVLYTKSLLDGVTSIILGSTMGIGVAISGIAVFLYQGAISVGAMLLGSGIDPKSLAIHEMSAVGGVLITCIGINILGITKIKVGNLLPSILIPILYLSYIQPYIQHFFK